LGTNFPAIDIDVDDEVLAEVILREAVKFLGPAPLRHSIHPRKLLVYRTEEPFAKIRLQIEYKGEEHVVELLGDGGQYVVHGTHPSGSEYGWDGQPLWEYGEDVPLIERQKVLDFFAHLTTRLAPYGVVCTIQGDGKAPAESAPPQATLKAPDLNKLRDIVQLIPNPSSNGWDQMVEMGYAIKAAGQDFEAEAKELFLDWCATWESGNDPERDVSNWESFKGPFRVGWSWLLERSGVNGAQYVFDLEADAPAPGQDVTNPRLVALRKMNEDYAVLQIESDVVILQERNYGGVVYLKLPAFRLKFRNRQVPSATQANRFDSLSEAWLSWEDRREYERVVFMPGELEGPPEEYNLWAGWEVEPSPSGSCDRFLDHLLRIVCDGVKDHYEWLLDWMAHLFQYPRVKPGVVVALQGGQGAGKTMVGMVLKRLLGIHHVIVDKQDQVMGRFNAHLAQCLVLQSEEAFWGGGKKGAGVLKNLTTGEYLQIERKGIDSVEMRSYLRLLVTTNEAHVWPTDLDDRRLAIFRVSSERVGDDEYFFSLHSELEKGGFAKLLHTLLTRILDGERLPLPPQTAGLRAQADESLSPEDSWILDFLVSGEVPGTVNEAGEAIVPLAALYSDYLESVPQRMFAKNQSAFGNLIAGTFNSKKAKGRRRIRVRGRQVRTVVHVFPPLAEVRAEYSRKNRAANTEWDEPNHWVPKDSSEFSMPDLLPSTVEEGSK